MLNCFTPPNNRIIQEFGDTCIPFPKIQGLPEGWSVVSVHYNAQWDGFDFIIHHPSFDPVPSTEHIPRLEVTVEVVQVDFKGNVVNTVEHKDMIA